MIKVGDRVRLAWRHDPTGMVTDIYDDGDVEVWWVGRVSNRESPADRRVVESPATLP